MSNEQQLQTDLGMLPWISFVDQENALFQVRENAEDPASAKAIRFAFAWANKVEGGMAAAPGAQNFDAVATWTSFSQASALGKTPLDRAGRIYAFLFLRNYWAHGSKLNVPPEWN